MHIFAQFFSNVTHPEIPTKEFDLLHFFAIQIFVMAIDLIWEKSLTTSINPRKRASNHPVIIPKVTDLQHNSNFPISHYDLSPIP